MDFPERMIALERRLLERFGANGTLAGKTTAYDPETDRQVEVAAPPRTVRMMVGPIETVDDQGRAVFRMVAKMQDEPKRDEVLSFAGRTYTVGNVITYYEADKPVLYVAEVD